MNLRRLVSLVALLLALSVISPKVRGADLCVFVAEQPTPDRTPQYWWGASFSGKLLASKRLASGLRAAGYTAVYSIATSRVKIHSSYQKWPLDDLSAINLGGLLGCRHVALGLMNSKPGGALPIIGEIGRRIALTLSILSVDGNKRVGELRLLNWGFAKTAEKALLAAVTASKSDATAFVRRVLRSAVVTVVPSKQPLLHVVGLTSPEQLARFRKELTTKVAAIVGSRLAGFRRGALTLTLRLQRRLRIFDTADYLVVELGKISLSGMRVKSIRGRKNQVWLELEPSS